jgi:hypothetical protein
MLGRRCTCPPPHRQREGGHYSCRASSGGSVVLVDEAAEPVATADLAHERSVSWLVGLGRPELERTVWPLAVVGR